MWSRLKRWWRGRAVATPYHPFRECPHCGSSEMADGPRGGASINVICIGCGARFNLAEIGPVRYFIEELSGPSRPVQVFGLRKLG